MITELLRKTDEEVPPNVEKILRKYGEAAFFRQGIIIAYSQREAKKRAIESGIETDSASSYLSDIVRKWKGPKVSWSMLKGARVLDLGSGSSEGHRPHFARLCAINGARVMAIDVNPQSKVDQELFDSIAANLVDVVLDRGLKNLPALKGSEFDIINSTNFVFFNFAPGLDGDLSRRGIEMKQFEEMLFAQTCEVLAVDGIMTLDQRESNYEQIFYTKKRVDFRQFLRTGKRTEIVRLP